MKSKDILDQLDVISDLLGGNGYLNALAHGYEPHMAQEDQEVRTRRAATLVDALIADLNVGLLNADLERAARREPRSTSLVSRQPKDPPRRTDLPAKGAASGGPPGVRRDARACGSKVARGEWGAGSGKERGNRMTGRRSFLRSMFGVFALPAWLRKPADHGVWRFTVLNNAPLRAEALRFAEPLKIVRLMTAEQMAQATEAVRVRNTPVGKILMADGTEQFDVARWRDEQAIAGLKARLRPPRRAKPVSVDTLKVVARPMTGEESEDT